MSRLNPSLTRVKLLHPSGSSVSLPFRATPLQCTKACFVSTASESKESTLESTPQPSSPTLANSPNRANFGLKKHQIKPIEVPPYPYGPARIYKQSDRGLYGGSTVQFGHNVAESGAKTRRIWRPNVKRKRLWSEALEGFVRLRVTTNVLRTIDKVGGLDEYVLGQKEQRIKELGLKGWELRWKILQSDKYKKQLLEEIKSSGMEPEVMLAKLAEKQQLEAELLEAVNVPLANANTQKRQLARLGPKPKSRTDVWPAPDWKAKSTPKQTTRTQVSEAIDA